MTIETLISTLGFPIAVTVWLLYERNKTLKELITVIQSNTSVIKEACDKLKQQ